MERGDVERNDGDVRRWRGVERGYTVRRWRGDVWRGRGGKEGCEEVERGWKEEMCGEGDGDVERGVKRGMRGEGG